MTYEEFLKECLMTIKKVDTEDLPLFFDDVAKTVKGNSTGERINTVLRNVIMEERKQAFK